MALSDLDELVAAGYPRPQLVRPGWVDCSGSWQLDLDDGDLGRDERWWSPDRRPTGRTIEVPFPPESPASGVAERGFHPVVWYRRLLPTPARGDGERLLVHFGAVDYEAEVWANGELVGRHRGGHTPFSFDLTGQCPPGAPLLLVVRVEDRPEDLHQPRGKQDWRLQPHAIWYHRTTGIWQPVWLEVVPACHVAGLVWRPRLEEALVMGEVALSTAPPGVAVEVELTLEGELLCRQAQSAHGRHVRLALAVAAMEHAWDLDRLTWSPRSPHLVEARVRLRDGAGGTLDEVRSYFGLRSVGTADGHFLLNGRPEQLRLVLSQGYWPSSHLAAPGPAALRAEVELVRRLGFNGARLHQKPEDPRLLYWADRLGVMVFGEMPSAGAFSARAARRTLHELAELVERDASHPAVVAWVPFNESWGVPALASRSEQRDLVAAAYHLVRALDPDRPVIGNDGWEQVEADLWGIHDYTQSGDELRRRYGDRAAIEAALGERWPGPRRVRLPGAADRAQPVLLSEIGGVALPAAGSGAGWHGYSTAAGPEDLERRLGELLGAVHACPDLAGFCYTQLCDTEQEENGLAWPDRAPKLPAERLRAIVEGAGRRPGGASA